MKTPNLEYAIYIGPPYMMAGAEKYGNAIVFEGNENEPLFEIDIETLIACLKRAKSRIAYSFNKFKSKPLYSKLEDIFKEIAKIRGNFKSRYSKLDMSQTTALLRIATHKSSKTERLSRSVEKHDLDKVFDFRFFDSNDPNNLTTYADTIHPVSELEVTDKTGNTKSVPHIAIDIDSEHLNEKDGVLAVIDAMIEFFETGSDFKHPFITSESETDYISLSQHITESLKTGTMKDLSEYFSMEDIETINSSGYLY